MINYFDFTERTGCARNFDSRGFWLRKTELRSISTWDRYILNGSSDLFLTPALFRAQNLRRELYCLLEHESGLAA
jgi:hypothetical protein